MRLRLVYFEMTTDVLSAIAREKRLKRLSRKRKLRLIETTNPEWKDLSGIEV
jgi:putative endonuclease